MLGRRRAIEHDSVLVLGDLVGYGANPNAVVDRVRELKPALVIRGNHDKVGAGLGAPKASTPSPARPSAGPTRR